MLELIKESLPFAVGLLVPLFGIPARRYWFSGAFSLGFICTVVRGEFAGSASSVLLCILFDSAMVFCGSFLSLHVRRVAAGYKPKPE